MAKNPNVSPPPPPPPAPAAAERLDAETRPVLSAPANPPDNAPGTIPDPLDSSVQSQPTVPPVPPAPPAPTEPTGTAGGTNTSVDGTAPTDMTPPANGASAEPAAAAQNEKPAGENGTVTREAELHGGVKASDYVAPDPDAEFDDLDPKLTEANRADAIAVRGFKAGRRGAPLGQRRKNMTDNEWARYQTAHASGKAQADVDDMSPEERMIRVEKALGLPIPGAVIYGEDDE